MPEQIFLGPGSTAANNGYMSVPTNSYNNNSQNGSDVRLISSTPSMTDSRQGSAFSNSIENRFSKNLEFHETFSIDLVIFCRIRKGKNFHRL